jgi:hypothetical protein
MVLRFPFPPGYGIITAMTHPSVRSDIEIELGSGRWWVACRLDQSLIGPVQPTCDRDQKGPV